MKNYIREWRSLRKLSLEEVGEKIGADKTQVSRLERGERRLTQEWLEKLAKALTTTPAELLQPPRHTIPMTRLPLNERDTTLSTIEQAARDLAPLIEPRITADELAWKLQRFLEQIRSERKQAAEQKEPASNR